VHIYHVFIDCMLRALEVSWIYVTLIAIVFIIIVIIIIIIFIIITANGAYDDWPSSATKSTSRDDVMCSQTEAAAEIFSTDFKRSAIIYRSS